MAQKRGQASIIILLGIVVVSLVAGVYFSRDYIFKSEWERLSERSLVVPRQAEDVKTFVMSCIEQAGEKAVDLVGQQGGYVSVPGDPIPFGIYNQFSNSLEVVGSLRVPYWYYKSSNNIDQYKIPNLEQIGRNIEGYASDQLRVCLGTFDYFKKQGYKINPGLIKTQAEIQKDKILFKINFPLHIELKDFKFDFKEFYYKSEKPLGALYDTARGIYNYENGKYFLEDKTVDIMVSSDKIPLTGEVFDCSTPIWSKYDVINNLKRLLTYNIQSLKVKDTNYDLLNKDRDYFEVDVGAADQNLNVNFIYSERWPFELEVSGDEGGILKAENAGSGLGSLKSMVESLICYSSWHFVYNIKYPVLVVLNKNDYTFQFATMVVVDRNEPRKNFVTPLESPPMDERFCENRQYGLTVSAYDYFGSPVSDVDLSYKCISNICDLGKTSGNLWTGEVMPCGNGFIVANKEGYHTSYTEASTLGDSSMSITIKKYSDLNVNVQVLRGGSGELREDETAYISLFNEEDNYRTSIVYPSMKTIKLIPGDYDVSLYIIKQSDKGISVPGREVQNCVDVPTKGVGGVFGATEEKCFTTKIPSMTLNQVISGAADFRMTVNAADLERGRVEFYIPYQGVPQKYEDLLSLSNEVGEGFVYPKFS